MSEIIAYASSTRPNHLWSAAQFNSALPKNRTECDIPLVSAAALAAKDAEIERLRTSLAAISGYENLSSCEFRATYPDFSKKLRQTSDDNQRIGVICDFAYLSLSPPTREEGVRGND